MSNLITVIGSKTSVYLKTGVKYIVSRELSETLIKKGDATKSPKKK